MKIGLTSKEVEQRLAINGYNELPNSKSKNIWKIAIEVVKEPMFLLLISCGLLYILIGDLKEGVILLSTIFIIIGITFFQYRKTERALDALKKLSSPRVMVLRDGIEMRVPGREIVKDDVILINEGDRIPADAILFESTNLLIDESLITGESMPVSKDSTDDHSILYSGTLVVHGKGKVVVTSTGIHAQLGKIAVSIDNIKEEEQTRLQNEMKGFVRNLALIGGIVSLSVVFAFYFTRGNFLQSLLNGLSASMAILPEEFPVVLTVFMALGAWRLSKRNVLARKPSAIETLGSATVLCSDKTGTITQNKMEVVALYDGIDLINKSDFSNDKSTLINLVNVLKQATPNDSIDPMEKAICQLDLGVSDFSNYKLVKEYPLSKALLAMTRVLKNESIPSLFVSTKGAPETIFKLCKLSDEAINKHQLVLNQMAQKGYRVLGVASAQISDNMLPDTQTEFVFEFKGLVALEDPIRNEVPTAIKECIGAGIKVIMITGDYPATANSIASQAGLAIDNIMTGDGLKQIKDEDLKEKIKHVTVFARVVPEQKLKIVEALKANGEIVAMTGDGVNDAPALKAAHIGVAMGNKGTDVAREASSLVLLDDNFASIVAAIRLGRRIFDNLQKAMSYIIAIHIPIIGLTLIPSFNNTIPLFLYPLHIVFMELIIDPICSVAFESEQEEKDIMTRKPRKATSKFFGLNLVLFSIFQGILLLAMVLGVYYLSIKEGHTEGEVRAITFSTLIIGNVFLILTNLSYTRNFFYVFIEKNMSAILILFAALILLLLVISLPTLQHVFNFEFPGYQHFMVAIVAATIMLSILEVIKVFKKKGIVNR